MQVDKPGVYHMPLADYISDPAPIPSLNAGTASTLLSQSPLHAWTNHPRCNPAYQSDESSRLDLGTIAHAVLLEGDSSRIVCVNADDWRTKDAKAKRDEARAAGKLPILDRDLKAVSQMVDVAQNAIASSEIADDFRDAVPEQTLMWEENGIWCRSRPDKATKDWRILFDYKTVAGSASPGAFSRAILNHGYDLQAALGLRGVDQLGLSSKAIFIFIVQEIEPPYAVSLVSLSPAWLTFAEDKLRMAMSIWKGCLRMNEWPAYSGKIAYLEPPAFAQVAWMDNIPEIDAEDFI